MKLSTNKDVNERARKTALNMVQSSFKYISKDKELNAKVIRADWLLESSKDSAKDLLKELIEITEEEHRAYLYLIDKYISEINILEIEIPEEI